VPHKLSSSHRTKRPSQKLRDSASDSLTAATPRQPKQPKNNSVSDSATTATPKQPKNNSDFHFHPEVHYYLQIKEREIQIIERAVNKTPMLLTRDEVALIQQQREETVRAHPHSKRIAELAEDDLKYVL
jgi:hypothetical protein